MTIYDKPPAEAVAMLAELIDTCDELLPLKECQLTVELSWAFGKPKKDGSVPDAITHQGHKALGLASKFKLQDRIHGKPDCRITVCGKWWETAPDTQRRALLFHELFHFEPQLDDAGAIKLDDANRPVINMRKHDVQFGWFWAPVRRFGAEAMETIQFKDILSEGGQLLLPSVFGDEPKDGDEKGAIDFASAARRLAAAVKSTGASITSVSFKSGDMEKIGKMAVELRE
jgi:hypothetical protein